MSPCGKLNPTRKGRKEEYLEGVVCSPGSPSWEKWVSIFLYRLNIRWIFFPFLAISIWAILPSSSQSISFLICWISAGWDGGEGGKKGDVSSWPHDPSDLIHCGGWLQHFLVGSFASGFQWVSVWVLLFSTETLQESGKITLCSCAAWHEDGNPA